MPNSPGLWVVFLLGQFHAKPLPAEGLPGHGQWPQPASARPTAAAQRGGRAELLPGIRTALAARRGGGCARHAHSRGRDCHLLASPLSAGVGRVKGWGGGVRGCRAVLGLSGCAGGERRRGACPEPRVGGPAAGSALASAVCPSASLSVFRVSLEFLKDP